MITLDPLARALVPVDSAAAARIGAPNYDEFQDDGEIWRLIRENPDSVLRITMAHCDVPAADAVGRADSGEALARAAANMDSLTSGPLTRIVEGLLFVYEITDPARTGIRQIGVGGLARTDEIRTPFTPEGPIIRNEGVREDRALGRARLVEATSAIIGTVNIAVPDEEGRLARALEAHASANAPDLEAADGRGNAHRIWLVTAGAEIRRLQEVLSWEPEAYVADGNHRSAAATLLGLPHFLAVFFPAGRMGIAPYNRLVSAAPRRFAEPRSTLEGVFHVESSPDAEAYQPLETHRIGLYHPETGWLRLRPRHGAFDPEDAARSIDHDIVQRLIFDDILGISDPGDRRLRFAGANRGAAWLQEEVDEGRALLAVTLPPVTMEQFVAVCRQGRTMPPKSTWFEPKIRSGLVMALVRT